MTFVWKMSLCYWKVGQRMPNTSTLLNKHKRKRLFKIFLARIDHIITWFFTNFWLQTIFEHTHIITSKRNIIEMLVKGMNIPFAFDLTFTFNSQLLGKIEILTNNESVTIIGVENTYWKLGDQTRASAKLPTLILNWFYGSLLLK